MSSSLAQFKKTVWSYYKAHRRDLPWRRSITPYTVIVSEIMLQQTQVPRAIPKFKSFIKRFPSWKSLAHASTKEVLQEWSGLGYNRRALYLKKIAEKVVSEADYAFLNEKISRLNSVSDTHDLLTSLPGIGSNTAGSILAFAFNIPFPFIETNIRSVFIHFFFRDSRKKVSDAEILPLIEKTLEDPSIRKNPRAWHSALMDYGTYIKGEIENPSRKSLHHVKQKKFKGSNRELRSKMLKFIMGKNRTEKEAVREFGAQNYLARQIRRNVEDLIKEGFIKRKNRRLLIA